MNHFKLGRRAPLWTPAHMQKAHLMGKALGALGVPPIASADFVSAVTSLVGNKWGMMLNDTLGDCTAADTGHRDMIIKANTGTWTGVPTDAEIEAFYSATTGYNPANPATDQGGDESAIEEYLISHGFLGNRASATAMVASGTIDMAACDKIRWAVQLFGGCRLGVNLPNSAEGQFDANVPWELTGDLTIDGGHDVVAVKYDPRYLYVVTWGGQPGRPDGLTPVAWDWVMRFCEEAHGTIYRNFVMSSGLTPDGFNMDHLVRNLQALSV